ncbi:MAG: V-type ATPase subunit [Clostridia bacterium]|nr:V-type ATPase subunit [Clostridia bacterium]
MRQDTNYAYAVARIKVMENQLLKSSDIDALIESTPEALISALTGFGYPALSNSSGDQNDENDLLSVYTSELSAFFAETVRSIMKFAPEPEVLKTFLLNTDYSNVKICIKEYGKFTAETGTAQDIRLSANGTVPVETVLNAFVKTDFEPLGAILAKAAKDASDELARSRNARNSDIIIDKYCFSAMKQAADSGCISTRRVMNKYLSIYADWKNMLTALRIKSSGSDAGLMDKAYLQGNLKKEYFNSVINSEIAPFAGTQYAKYIDAVLTRSGKVLQEQPDISFYEQLSSAYIDGQLMKDRNEPYKINALLAFIARRRREISLIRLIIVGKRSGLDAGKIRELIEKSALPLQFIEGV